MSPAPKKSAARKPAAKKDAEKEPVDQDDDLAPDADELGDEAPAYLEAMLTDSNEIIPDQIDKPDPKDQVST